jgi:predicted permease
MPRRPSRWVRALLRLLPADVRGDFGRDIAATLADEHRDAGTALRRLHVSLRNLAAFVRVGIPLHAEQTSQDFRLGFRTLAAAPAFAGVALAALGLGIGGAATTFSVADSFLFKPLPFAEPHRLVHLWGTDRPRGFDTLRVSLQEYEAWNRLTGVFDGVAFFNYLSEELTGGPAPERVATGRVSTNVFDVLGVRPGLGRGFEPGEDRPGAEPVVVISHRFWQRRLGGSQDVLSRRVDLAGIGHRIVGVMPASFAFPLPVTDLWAPRVIDRARLTANVQPLQVLARLAPGVTRDQAMAAAGRASADLAAVEPVLAGRGVHVVPLREALNFAHEMFAFGAAVIGAANLLLLLTVCANLSSLMMSRAIRRGHEAALRAALGASRLRLVRQYVAEGIVLSLAGGLLGALVAAWSVGLLNQIIPVDLFRAADFAIDARTGAVVFLLSMISTIAFALLPALRLAHGSLAIAIRRDGGAGTTSRHTQRLQSALVVAQIALAIVLLAGTALVMRSVAALAAVDPGFDPDRVLTVHASLPRQRYATPDTAARFQAAVLSRVSALPGALDAAFVNFLPLNHETQTREFTPRGWAGTGRLPSADQLIVTPGYFAVLRIPVIDGRAFDHTDRRGAPPAVVINESLARRYWPTTSPVGSTLQFTGGSSPATIVGVVGDTLQRGLTDRGRGQIFLAQAQTPGTSVRLIVKTAGDPMAIADAVAGIIREIDPLLPLAEMRSLEQVVDEFLLPQHALRVTLGVLGVVALCLMIVGVYGIVITHVTERTREMGIRMAIGAAPGQIERHVLGRGLRLAAWGVALGTPLSMLIGLVARDLLFGVSAASPFTYVGVAGAVMFVAAVASLGPARRAARISPLIAMRIG